MSERVVNLDNSPRPSVTLVVAGESFTIRRVVTGVNQLWSAFVQETATAIEESEAYNKARREAREKQDAEAGAKLDADLEGLLARFDALNAPDRLLPVIELLLTKNGYAFDRQWWVNNAGPEDYREFITEVLTREHGSKKNGDAGES
jgi:hypothetical protein